MTSRILNLGIVAHVDAGKTSLTERLLADAGVIDHLGSVDTGDTQTDTGSIERRRGITINSAVVSFTAGDLQVNIVDTPGHAEFVAEVERALAVLDGAVLVVSAAHGVQPRTRILMRTLRRMRLPTLIFVNKIDMPHLDLATVEADIAGQLTPRPLRMTEVRGTAVRRRQSGDRPFDAEMVDVLTLSDDRLLADLVAGRSIRADRLMTVLRKQIGSALVHPVLHGSAVTGAGVPALVEAIRELLTTPDNDRLAGQPLAAEVFKVGRDSGGARAAYVRLAAGSMRRRDRVPVGGRRVKVTSVKGFSGGSQLEERPVSAGEIAVLHTDPALRIGDVLGPSADRRMRATGRRPELERPALETVVRSIDPAGRLNLRSALQELADEDPLIAVRLDDGEFAVSLYGDIQRQVLADRLSEEFGVAADFSPPAAVYVQRPAGNGAGLEVIGGEHRLMATVGLSIAPAPAGSGVRYVRPTEFNGLLPRAFHTAIAETVPRTLAVGPAGWPVTDAVVTLTASGYSSVHSTASDFRLLVPLVLAAAIAQSGTTGYEPLLRVELDLPTAYTSQAMTELLRRGAGVEAPKIDGGACVLTGVLPATAVYELQRDLASFTGAEGVLVTRHGGWRQLRQPLPERRRRGPNPFNRVVYLRDIAQGVRV
ncbi:MAG: TetM/TetW/TetO/TetS family tetracycline resistance ribosomal protection protein [Actinomycetota bacterium]|nr:TetM/TetW/TetO/TetS family tetracycline resistance ribosomal protection protein [Actinomycetota bacterium]